MPDLGKIAIIGCGAVGSTTAFTLMQSGLFSKILLVDLDREHADGEALDISHGEPYGPAPVRIVSGDYSDIAKENVGIIVMSAGVSRKPGETRLDLITKNGAICKSILAEIRKINYQGILIVVSNPVDILTYMAVRLSGLPETKVIGTGAMLDTVRLRHILSEKLGVSSRDVQAFAAGEHGDHRVILWNHANIAGEALVENDDFKRYVGEEIRLSGQEIIKRKAKTFYGIAMCVERLCQSIVHDEHGIYSVSHMFHGEYGIDDVCISTPVMIGKEGIMKHEQGGAGASFSLQLTEDEQDDLREAANVMKGVIDKNVKVLL